MPYKFVTPTVEIGPAGGHRLFEFYTLSVGYTVVKYNGEYQDILYPSEDFLAECEEVYMGAHEHEVSNTVAAALTAAGYGEFLTEL